MLKYRKHTSSKFIKPVIINNQNLTFNVFFCDSKIILTLKKARLYYNNQ